MDLITLLIAVCIFVFVVWGGFWICDRAGFPIPVRWLWGGICLILLIYFVVDRINGGGGGAFLHRPL